MAELMFAEANPEKVIADMSVAYERKFFEITGQHIALRPADTARLMIATASFAVNHLETLIDHAAKMNLLPYSEGAYLDALADGITDPRKDAVAAFTTVEIHFSAALADTQTIVKGTRVTAGDGIYWATENDVMAYKGAISVSVRCVCQKPGAIGNGYVAGSIKTLVDTSNVRFFASLENTDTSSGGADAESDTDFKERIRTAPETYSVAGPTDAYAHLIKKFDANIADVLPTSPTPGVVKNYIVMKDGYTPSEEYIAEVQEYISGKTRRPMTESVTVALPDPVEYSVDVSYAITAENAAREAELTAKIEKAVDEYVAWQERKIGRDVDPTELIARMKNAGASRVTVAQPKYTAVQRGEYDESTGTYKPVQVAKLKDKIATYWGAVDE